MLNVDSSVVCKCASDAQKRDEVIGLRDARSTRVHWDLASFTPLLFESFKPSTAHLHPNIGREPPLPPKLEAFAIFSPETLTLFRTKKS